MTEDQLSHLFAFARGDTTSQDFEQWFYEQPVLEERLGETRYFGLLSADYRDREQVRALRSELSDFLEQFRQCECPAIPSSATIPMGGDFYFEKVFDTLREIAQFGPDKWWLDVSRCDRCDTNWLIAQDDRIYDEFFMERITRDEAEQAEKGSWPAHFQTYEAVLQRGRQTSNPPVFFDSMAWSLVCTAQDLLRERPEITTEEIGYLLGLRDSHAERIVRKAKATAEE